MSKRIIYTDEIQSQQDDGIIRSNSKLRYKTDPNFDDSLDVVNKRYVDESFLGVDLFLRLDGSNSMLADLPMDYNNITNINKAIGDELIIDFVNGDVKDNTNATIFNKDRKYFDEAGNEIFSTVGGKLKIGPTGATVDIDFSAIAAPRNRVEPDKDGTYAMTVDILAAIINTAYGAGWSGDTTHAPSADVLYNKLSDLDTQITALSLYLGKFTSLVALQTAYPTSTSGHWAIVDPGSGTDAKEYLWDDEAGWVLGSGTAGVTSIFGRTGVVTAMAGDYTTAQITEVTNLFFTVARVYAAAISTWTPGSGTIAPGDTLQQILQKLSGNIAALTTTYHSIQSGTGILNTFNIAHGLSGTPTEITATANSIDAAGITYVSADATNIIIHYNIAPPSGTNNLKFTVTAKL